MQSAKERERLQDLVTGYLLMFGSPLDGFEFVGPFNSDTEAMDVALADPYVQAAGWDWWIVTMYSKEYITDKRYEK